MQRYRLLEAALCVGVALPSCAVAQTRSGDAEPAQRLPAVELYGFVFGQLAAESHRTGRDRFLNIQPLPGQPGVEDDDPDAFFDVLASRVGLNLRAGRNDGAAVYGNLEIDFDTPDGGPRIRHAFGELTVGRWRFLAGQTWAVVSQLNPATINSDNLFNLGNTYERVPQVRVSYAKAVGSGTLELQLGAMTFFGVFDQGGLAVRTDPAAAEPMSFESNTPPVLQGRVQFGWETAGRQAQVAIGASGGRIEARAPSGTEDGATHLLVGGELLLPINSTVAVMVEGFYGSGAGFNGGVGQTAVVTAAGALEPITSWGGFGQIALSPAQAVSLNLIAGLDDPETRPAGTALTIGRNWTVLGNVFWNAAEHMTYAAELQFLRTEYEASAATADNVRVTVALFLHL